MALIERIYSSLSNEQDALRPYVGASSIGNDCHRSIWYAIHRPEEKQVSSQQQIILNIGKRMEGLVIEWLQQSGLRIAPLWFDLEAEELPEFKGHLDAVWLDASGEAKAIIEIKTAKDSSFNQFVKKGLKLWMPSYFDQVQSYMGMSDILICYVIVLNKNTGKLAEEKVTFDEAHYKRLIDKARLIAEARVMPPRINGSPSYYKCKMCFFREFCHGIRDELTHENAEAVSKTSTD